MSSAERRNATGEVRSQAGKDYVYSDLGGPAQDQHRWLAEMLDPITTARLDQTGVSDGWSCLEVGAGGGSVSAWLARRVGPTGAVLATDIAPGHISPADGVDVIRHDVAADPLPESAFDLIIARLVLMHLPGRRAVLDKLLNALKPGGWLQLDEFDVTYGPALLVPDRRSRDLYYRFLAAKAEALRMAGADPAWGRHASEAMREAGLVDIDPAVYVEIWQSGSAGVKLLLHHIRHMRVRLVSSGMSDDQLAELEGLLATPGFKASSCAIYSIQGRRPGIDLGSARSSALKT